MENSCFYAVQFFVQSICYHYSIEVFKEVKYG